MSGRISFTVLRISMIDERIRIIYETRLLPIYTDGWVYTLLSWRGIAGDWVISGAPNPVAAMDGGMVLVFIRRQLRRREERNGKMLVFAGSLWHGLIDYCCCFYYMTIRFLGFLSKNYIYSFMILPQRVYMWWLMTLEII